MTREEYSLQLRRIERENPTEPLLPVLRAGWSRANVMYMQAALRRVNTVAEKVAEPAIARQTDENLRKMWAERTRLFGEMNKMSNYFHDCKTDAERAANSAAILQKWQEITAVKAKIAHYEQHGDLPAAEADENEELPENPVLLSKKLNSLRAGISQTKSKLESAAGLDDNTPDKAANIEKLEAKLKRLKHLAGKAEVKLKTYESAA